MSLPDTGVWLELLFFSIIGVRTKVQKLEHALADRTRTRLVRHPTPKIRIVSISLFLYWQQELLLSFTTGTAT
jgi:hypothetical protein